MESLGTSQSRKAYAIGQMGPTTLRATVCGISEASWNYWLTYAVDLTLMTFFLVWDVRWLRASPVWMVPCFVLGIIGWSLSEYCFHRWIYHLDWGILSHGHDTHHENPTAHVAMPWFVTPILFIPPQVLVAYYFAVGGFSTFLAGWFAGFVAYSFLHHSLHRYNVRFAWYRHLQSQHRIHHAFPETNFGVTMRYWDRVFGTEFKKERRPG